MSVWLRTIWEDLKAWRRGERRVVPRRACNGQITRGRIYAPKRGQTAPALQRAASEPIVTITARHIRNGEVIGEQVVRGRIERTG